MSEVNRYYLTELLRGDMRPKVQGRELVFADDHDKCITEIEGFMKGLADRIELAYHEDECRGLLEWVDEIRKKLEENT